MNSEWRYRGNKISSERWIRYLSDFFWFLLFFFIYLSLPPPTNRMAAASVSARIKYKYARFGQCPPLGSRASDRGSGIMVVTGWSTTTVGCTPILYIIYIRYTYPPMVTALMYLIKIIHCNISRNRCSVIEFYRFITLFPSWYTHIYVI